MNARLRNILTIATDLSELEKRRRTLLERLNALLGGHTPRKKTVKFKRHGMTAKQRQDISVRMKKYWASRRENE